MYGGFLCFIQRMGDSHNPFLHAPDWTLNLKPKTSCSSRTGSRKKNRKKKQRVYLQPAREPVDCRVNKLSLLIAAENQPRVSI